MSVRLKKAAKALRARFGVALGVQQAKPGDRCRAPIPSYELVRGEKYLSNGKGDYLCGQQAHVVGLCYSHMKAAGKPLCR